tara:strand:+ start:324 stop:515 length:192 start_codon:yes stop_codon:yes gene_type:complete
MNSTLYAFINVGIGCFVAILITHYILPHWGYQASLTNDITVTAIYTVAALIRNDIVYRIFHRG